jgi:hypothetical protein
MDHFKRQLSELSKESKAHLLGQWLGCGNLVSAEIQKQLLASHDTTLSNQASEWKNSQRTGRIGCKLRVNVKPAGRVEFINTIHCGFGPAGHT